MVELLSTKFFIPPLRFDLVPRPRLIQRLNEGLIKKRKLTLVSAPAGFGKTTLVVNWLDGLSLKVASSPPQPTTINLQPAARVAWLSLEEADNDLPRFLAYLAAALQQVDDGVGASLLSALQSPQPPAVEQFLTAMLNEIALQTEPLILVLDDYHLLSEAAVLQAMEFLLSHQPPQLHLVLTAREDPDLPLARLRARDQLTEIRARDLRFTQDEVNEFFRRVMGLDLSREDIAALEERTEGWAAGLQLAGLSMQNQADPQSFIDNFSGSNRHILDYLADEVLQQQPESIRSFLLQTAILERMCAPLCEKILEDEKLADWKDAENNPITQSFNLPTCQSILEYLDHANLFLVPLDEERRWYRYHHLFADLLRNQLARTQPEIIPDLHRRASRWYEENQDIQAAIDHALQDTDLTRAAHLLERYTLPKLYQGEVARVLGWFDRLQAGILESDPMLCIGKAWALVLMQRSMRRGEVEQTIQAAEKTLDRVSAGQALRDRVAGHAASIRAYLLQRPALTSKNPKTLIALAQEAMRLLPAEEKAIRSANALNIGYGYLALAELEPARIAFQQALEDGLAGGNYYAAIYGPINLVLIACLVGRLSEALQLSETYLARFNQFMAGQNFPPVGALYILKGSILLEYNRLAEAEEALVEGLDLIRWTGEHVAHRKGYTALARLRAIQGDLPATLKAVQALAEAWPEGAFYVQALRHRLLLRHWPADPGVRNDAQAWLSQAGIELGKLAASGGVDQFSAVDFESCLHAAHVLAHVSNEKPGDYPVEGIHSYLKFQQDFAVAHGFAGRIVEINVARALQYQVSGKKAEALGMLERAIRVAAPTGFFRAFVDECESLQALLVELKPRLAGADLAAYAGRLLDAMRCGSPEIEAGEADEAPLSERELEVLRFLASGLSYAETGRQLFLSLNTVQFHVKNIYRKLLVNKRVQAIERARQLHLI